MESFPRFHLDFTFIILIISYISLYYVDNKILNISSISLLFSLILLGNLLTYLYSKIIARYYNTTQTLIILINVLTHIIIPIYLLYNIIPNTDFDLNTKELILILILCNVIVFGYFILMRLKYCGSYGLSVSILTNFGIAAIFIILIILYIIINKYYINI